MQTSYLLHRPPFRSEWSVRREPSSNAAAPALYHLSQGGVDFRPNIDTKFTKEKLKEFRKRRRATSTSVMVWSVNEGDDRLQRACLEVSGGTLHGV